MRQAWWNGTRGWHPSLRIRGGGVITIACFALVVAPVVSPAAPPRPLVFDGVTVIDVVRGQRLPDERVVIVGNRIQRLGRISTVAIPAGAQVIDSRDKYLIPGLWDMHTHSNNAVDTRYPLFLANGITGIRDAWSYVPLDTLTLWRREILAGTRVGPPRQFFVGAALDARVRCDERGKGHLCVTSGDAADVRKVVDSLKAAGADLLKMYNLDRETYFLVAAEARRIGIPFGGHLTAATAAQASDSGASILDHVNSSGDLDEACLPAASGVNTATEADCRALAERFRHNHTWWCPTLLAEEWAKGLVFTPSAQAILAQLAAISRAATGETHTMPRRTWLTGVGRASDATLPRAAVDASSGSTSSTGLLQMVHEVGLPIVAGTDGAPDDALVPGFKLHAELATYVAEGLTPLEALQTATLNPAMVLRVTDSLGTVAAGKLADLVLLDADPLTDIRNTTTIRAVVANGRYIDRVTLDQFITQALQPK